jgi:hypothetical protein
LREHVTSKFGWKQIPILLFNIASAEGVSSAYIYTLLRLRWLAPSIVTAIVDGRQPDKFTASRLMRLSARLPTRWNEQRTLLGFSLSQRMI